jgi:hypothetical protein
MGPEPTYEEDVGLPIDITDPICTLQREHGINNESGRVRVRVRVRVRGSPDCPPPTYT